MKEIIIDGSGVTLSRLEEEHIDEILELMNKEGWYYYDHHELMRYLELNQDCFTLLKDERIIGSIFTTNYTNQAWIGNIIIAKELRGMGLAEKMIRGVIDYLHKNKNILTFRLGSVPLAIALYKKVGFHAEAFTTAQEADLPLSVTHKKIDLGKSVEVVRLNENDLEEISKIDEQYFKSNRLELLTNLFHDSMKESCFCLKDQGKIMGFLMIRRRQTSKVAGCFAQGPDHVYRLGPSSILPEYSIKGFKALFQESIKAVNEEVCRQQGSAKIYVVFPRNADKFEIYEDTRKLAQLMEMDTNMELDKVFNEHDLIFGASKSKKNEEQWNYMESLGFHQEYFEQIMSYTPTEAVNAQTSQKHSEKTKANPEGLFASATPGDKA